MIFSGGWGGGGRGEKGAWKRLHCTRERANELKGNIMFANCVR